VVAWVVAIYIRRYPTTATAMGPKKIARTKLSRLVSTNGLVLVHKVCCGRRDEDFFAFSTTA